MILNNAVFQKDEALIFFVLCDGTLVDKYVCFFLLGGQILVKYGCYCYFQVYYDDDLMLTNAGSYYIIHPRSISERQ